MIIKRFVSLTNPNQLLCSRCIIYSFAVNITPRNILCMYIHFCEAKMSITYSKMSKYYRNHPNGEIILKIKYTPNAKHLWNACKEKIYIKDENIEPGNNAFCYFNLCGNYSEKRLKKDIMKIHNKRLRTEDI
ncbi:hypothetical protein [Moumouvirus maliensis]|nr:hypothetical protein [Moumouvirus maliensis]